MAGILARTLDAILDEEDSLSADVAVGKLRQRNRLLVSQHWVDFLQQLGCHVHEDMTTAQVVNDWLAELCAERNMTCVDPLQQFRAEQARGQELYLQTDDHMTPLGYRLLGEALARALDPLISQQRRGS